MKSHCIIWKSIAPPIFGGVVVKQYIQNVVWDWFYHPSWGNWLMSKNHTGFLCMIIPQYRPWTDIVEFRKQKDSNRVVSWKIIVVLGGTTFICSLFIYLLIYLAVTFSALYILCYKCVLSDDHRIYPVSYKKYM
jgi:hypothetical protein